MTDELATADFYKFKIGRFECISVSDGSYDYDPLTFFPTLDQTEVIQILKDHNVRPDKLVSPYTFLFVDTGTNKILCDTGAGKLGPNTGKLIESLKLGGVQPEDIDTIIITHAHPDHIGGTLNEEGKPNYPNARYFMWQGEWDFWFSDDAFQRVLEHYSGIALPDVFLKAARGQLGPVKDRITLISEESEILPGVFIHKAFGHTPGHIVVSFVSEGDEVFFTSDTVVFPFLLERPDLHAIFDIIPEQADQTKRRICALLGEKGSLVLAQHFHPFPSLGHIVKKEVAWQWQPIKPD